MRLTRRGLLGRAVAAVAASACAPAVLSPSTTPSSAPAAIGLESPIAATLRAGRWLVREPSGALQVRADFASDPSAALPRARVQDEEAAMVGSGAGVWTATIDASRLPSGTARVQLVQRLRGGDVITASAQATLTHTVYVAWTLDHEGYDEPDDYLANVAAVAESAAIPLTILFHPRVLNAGAIERPRRDAVVRWVLARAAHGDEIGLHLHVQFDYVKSAGVTPRGAPRWGDGAGDGYDIPLTQYDADEQRKLIERGLALMSAAQLPRPTSFRAGGQFADARTLRVLSATGFAVDASGQDGGFTGAIRLPWSLRPDQRPYRPNADDANAEDPNGLPLLEVPTLAGNTFRDDLAELRRRQAFIWSTRGGVSRPTVLTYVSHPSTFASAERGKVEAAFAPLVAALADRDAGPVRFVTLAQLARAWR